MVLRALGDHGKTKLILGVRIVLIFGVVAGVNGFFLKDLEMCWFLLLGCFALSGPSLTGLMICRLIGVRGFTAVGVTKLLVGRAQITLVVFGSAMPTRSIPHEPLAWSASWKSSSSVARAAISRG